MPTVLRWFTFVNGLPGLRRVWPAKSSLCIRLCLALGVFPLTVLSQKIEVQYDHDADFSRYHTFAIRQG